MRSSTCAALIALAAAAGISRFEPAPAKPLPPLPALVQVLAALAKNPETHHYPLSLATFAETAPAARMSVAAADLETATLRTVDAPAADWPPAPPVLETENVFFAFVGAAPTAREHSHPYAVGPPRRGIKKPLRAAGHAWPGDSSARRSQGSRIARVLRSAPRACPERAEWGEPGLLPRSILPPASFGARPRDGFAFFSP